MFQSGSAQYKQASLIALVTLHLRRREFHDVATLYRVNTTKQSVILSESLLEIATVTSLPLSPILSSSWRKASVSRRQIRFVSPSASNPSQMTQHLPMIRRSRLRTITPSGERRRRNSATQSMSLPSCGSSLLIRYCTQDESRIALPSECYFSKPPLLLLLPLSLGFQGACYLMTGLLMQYSQGEKQERAQCISPRSYFG